LHTRSKDSFVTTEPVIYIGYPKAASTYVCAYLENHAGVQLIDIDIPNAAEPTGPFVLPDEGSLRVYANEKIAESLIAPRGHVPGKPSMFDPDAGQENRDDVAVDPAEMARRLRILFPGARILIVIRDQGDWLSSAYRYFLPRLPPRQRSFVDFCRTSRGMACLEAGHYDRTISAYVDAFGANAVCVLRFELLRQSRDAFVEALCVFLGVEVQPPREGVVNESSSVAVSLLRRHLPFGDALPAPLRRVLGNIVNALAGRRRRILSDETGALIEAFYAESNRRTDELLAELSQPAGPADDARR
jgi:hypothetical protein